MRETPSDTPDAAGPPHLQALAALAEALARVHGLPAAATVVARALPAVAEFDYAAIAIRSGDGKPWAVVAVRGQSTEPAWAPVTDLSSPLLAAANSGTVLQLEREAPAAHPGATGPDALKAVASVLCWPLRGPEGVVGSFGIFSTRPGACARADPGFMQTVALLVEAAARRIVLADEVTRTRDSSQAGRMGLDLAALLVADLRGPLAVLDSGLDYLDGALLPVEHEEVHAFVRELRLASSHVTELAGNLLEVARIEQGRARPEPKPVLLDVFVQERAARHREAARVVELTLTSRTEPPGAVGTFDAALMGRALDQLLVNALRHTPRRGQAALVARRDGAELTFAVADTGPAIPAADRERLFSRHGAAVAGGLMSRAAPGLGFHLCRLVAELHGGTARVDDGPVGGPVFRIIVPAGPPG